MSRASFHVTWRPVARLRYERMKGDVREAADEIVAQLKAIPLYCGRPRDAGDEAVRVWEHRGVRVEYRVMRQAVIVLVMKID